MEFTERTHKKKISGWWHNYKSAGRTLPCALSIRYTFHMGGRGHSSYIIFPCFLFSIFSHTGSSFSWDEKALVQECEKRSLKAGSDLADEFNALIGDDMDCEARTSQNFIVSNLGFAPWISKGMRSSGRTVENADAKALQEKGGWIGKTLRESPYGILGGKWIYFYGDSTLRQIWAAFAAPFQGISAPLSLILEFNCSR